MKPWPFPWFPLSLPAKTVVLAPPVVPYTTQAPTKSPHAPVPVAVTVLGIVVVEVTMVEGAGLGEGAFELSTKTVVVKGAPPWPPLPNTTQAPTKLLQASCEAEGLPETWTVVVEKTETVAVDVEV